MVETKRARYTIGNVVRHRLFGFRGVVYDIDPEFDHTDEWYDAIPDNIKPRKDQPFYHLYAVREDSDFMAYVSEQNLEPDETGTPVAHPAVNEVFETAEDGQYKERSPALH
ncbi:MAG: heat shock protein HspQ [Pseudomonadota bacterium]